jgi:hypothetical protein
MQSYAEILESRASSLARRAKLAEPAKRGKSESIADCGSRHCSWCYEVAQGVNIHPPKSGEDWKAWLLKWEPKGKVQ